jgi:hypothetical protein
VGHSLVTLYAADCPPGSALPEGILLSARAAETSFGRFGGTRSKLNDVWGAVRQWTPDSTKPLSTAERPLLAWKWRTEFPCATIGSGMFELAEQLFALAEDAEAKDFR